LSNQKQLFIFVRTAIMATVSFNKSFVIENPVAFDAIIKDLDNPRKVKVTKRDYNAESVKGIQLLKQRLSNSKP
jgi:hypothetical protein